MSIFGNEPVKLRVKPGDLARFDAAALASLDDAGQALLRSHLAAADARIFARRARDDHERVSARRGGAKADVKLAKAERSSALAHADVPGAQGAERSIERAQGEKSQLDGHIAWLHAEVAAAEAREEEANAAAWASEADFELARARLLASDQPHGTVHLPAFVKQSEACHKTLEDARHRLIKLRAEADKQKNLWQQSLEPA